MKHVKIIAKSDLLELEKAINEFLNKEGDQVMDIKFSVRDWGFYALLIF